jgi:hypothetical protein
MVLNNNHLLNYRLFTNLKAETNILPLPFLLWRVVQAGVRIPTAA